MELGDRIQERLAVVGLSQAELARRVGVAQPTINNLIHRNKVGSKHLHRIARELQTSPGYLTGETNDPSEGALPVPSVDDIAEQLDAVLIPEFEVGLSMGGGSSIEDWPVVRQVPISRSWLRTLTDSGPEHIMVVRGDGDSMMPTILDQDLVIIDRNLHTPKQQDRIWAMVYGGWGMIKRLRSLPDGSLQINSDNKEVSPIHAYDGEASIIGRVVGIVRKI